MATVDPRNPRATPIRKKTWQPPSLLPDPAPSEEWAYRWIATAVNGEEHVTNVSVRLREGWTPVRPEEVPEISTQVTAGNTPNQETDKGVVKIGGLMLCKMPKELAASRKEYYEGITRQQQESVDNNYMRESNPRMPLLRPERTSQVTFGRGPRRTEPASET